MVVSGRADSHVQYGPNSWLRQFAFRHCPLFEMACTTVLCVLMLSFPSVQLKFEIGLSTWITGGVAFACIIAIRVGIWLFCVVQYALRATSQRTFEIAFCGLPAREECGVVYDGHMFWFKNIGNLPAGEPPHVPNNDVILRQVAFNYLSRTQLIAHRQVADDDASPIMGWSFRVCWGRYLNRRTTTAFAGWRLLSKDFPVDPARLHDFHRWLAQDWVAV